MPRKKTNEKGAAPTVADSPATDSGLAVDLPEHDEMNFDDFQEWFGDGSENVSVQIYRLEPKFHQGERVDGYVGDLAPGMTHDEFRIMYGGKLFQLKRKVDGRFTNVQRRFRVSAAPVVDCPPATVAAVGESPPSIVPGAVVPTMDVRGCAVPVGDFDMLKQAALFARTMDQLLPEKPDLNLELIKMLMDAKGGSGPPDLLAQADQLAGLAGKLRDLAGGGGGDGPGWFSLGEKALGAFSKLLEARNPSGIPGLPGPVKPGNQIEQARPTAGNSLEDTRTETGQTPGKPTETTEGTDVSQLSALAEKAASYIVQGFMMEPQQVAADTVRVLNTVLGIPESYRAGIIPYKEDIGLVCRSVLCAQVEPQAEDYQKLSLYFDLVFDMFVGTKMADSQNPEHEVDNAQQTTGSETPSGNVD